tara:strand:+ start:699 stop:1115 length:417 start_codon:yes stop_codon:yes gene_type:complete
MKITKSKLKQIIREELSRMINEEETGRKFTHKKYDGVTFTEYTDPKSGYEYYVGKNEEGDEIIRIDSFGPNRALIKQMDEIPRPSRKKFTHPEYKGFIFTKERDPKSDMEMYRGRDTETGRSIIVDNPRKIKQMVPVK